MKQPNATLGEVIYDARHNVGKTLRQLSEETGISLGSLHALEHNVTRTPSPANLALLAPALGVWILDLYEAAGYGFPIEIDTLGSDFVHKLAGLSPEARVRVRDLTEELWKAEHPELGGTFGQSMGYDNPHYLKDEYYDDLEEDAS
jgi:transcriptional regulator with XRE-family HTH domain